MSVAINGESTRISESSTDTDHEPDFEPIVALPEIEVCTHEENEEELIKLRAKLFRFDTSNPEAPEWKERGTGEVKLLRHKENNAIRIVMRRDKTFKICANHFITPSMDLKPSCGTNRAWVWTVVADFADEKLKPECLAIRFANADIATQWKNKFDEAKLILTEKCELYKNNDSTSENTDSDSRDSSISKANDTNENEEIAEVVNKIGDLDVTK